jgi:hypothetical protein
MSTGTATTGGASGWKAKKARHRQQEPCLKYLPERRNRYCQTSPITITLAGLIRRFTLDWVKNKADSIRVYWSNGNTETFINPGTDRYIKLVQGQGTKLRL